MKQKIDILLVTAILFLLSHTTTLLGQKVITLTSKIGKTYDFEFSQERQELWFTCDSIFDKGFQERHALEELKTLSNKCDEMGYNEACDDMWSIICGNDWTDEGYAPDFFIDENGTAPI